jgi:tetratricopeptide (TPR) repeat protein
LSQPGPRPPARLAAALALALLATLPAGAQEAAHEPTPRIALSLAEVGLIAALREQARGSDSAATVAASEAYLEAYPEGAYRDEALLALGDALAAWGQSDLALDAYRRLIDGFPDSPFREYALARSYAALHERGRNAEARSRLDTLLQRYPSGLTRTQVEFWWARERADGLDPASLIAALDGVEREQLGSPQDKIDYDRLLGTALARAGQRGRAEPYLARYLEAEDSAEHKAPVLMMLADEARLARRFDQALRFYEQIPARYPHPPHLPAARFWRAEVYVRAVLDPAEAGQKAAARTQAIAHYSDYLDSGDSRFQSRALQHRAELLAAMARDEEALRDYDRLLELEPAYRNEPTIITARAALLVKLGREQEAVAFLNQAGHDPGIAPSVRGDLLIEQARVHYDQENCQEVLRLLRPLPAFENSEQVNQAMFLRGFCHHRMGDWEEASADLEVLSRYPRQLSEVWEPLVDAYEHSGQFSRMVRFLEEQMAATRIQPSSKTYDQLAHGYEQLNQPALVIATYRQLEAFDPQALQTPEAQVRLGKAEEGTGRPDRAIERYERALAVHPPGQDPGAAYREALARLRGLLTRTGQWERLVRQIEAAEPVLSSQEERARLREAKRAAYLGWGKAEAAAGRDAPAAVHLQASWELTPEHDPVRRLEILALLAPALRKSGQADQAVAAFRTELEGSEDGPYRVQLSAALARFYQDWAQSVEREQGIAEASPLYEQALLYLPEAQWEARYKIVERLDPLYREGNRFDRLIGYLEPMEQTVTDGQFRANLRRYRMDLHRLWGARLAEEGKFEEAGGQFGKAMALLLFQDNWSGLADLAGARAETLRQEREFEDQSRRLSLALARAADPAAREEARLGLVATRFHWGALRESQGDFDGALAHYAAARERLTEADWRWRRDLMLRMAQAYRKRGDPAQQLATLEELLAQAPRGKERDSFKLTIVEANLDWARELEQSGQPDQSLERYRKALAMVERPQWSRRYAIVQEMAHRLLKDNDTQGLVALYEDVRPDVQDEELMRQIDLFLGQLYAQWAGEALRARKFEFAKRRYIKALGFLPAAQWELRTSVVKQLEALYDQENAREAVAGLYASLVPTLPEGDVRRQYALYLGRLYWDQAKQGQQAAPWLRAADAGESDPVSVEAAFLLTEIALAAKKTDQARTALEKLAQRELKGSAWYVPVHYQLAVLYHQDSRLREALSQYKRVAEADSSEAKKQYPKLIAQSREQVSQLEQYLRIRGGDAGSRIDAPAFIQKPPTPGPKER